MVEQELDLMAVWRKKLSANLTSEQIKQFNTDEQARVVAGAPALETLLLPTSVRNSWKRSGVRTVPGLGEALRQGRLPRGIGLLRLDETIRTYSALVALEEPKL